MNDIAERLLRTPLENASGYMLGEAADEICRLRAENARLYEWKDKAGDMDRVKTVELVDLRAENARLREALSGLNAAIDAFWNDKTRPSIAHMNDQTLLKVEAAQRAARAAMGESDE